MNDEKPTEKIQSEGYTENPAGKVQPKDTINDESSLEESRSKVRIVVTYAMLLVYAISAPGVVFWLFYIGETGTAVAAFSGIVSTTTGIIAFWFGNRQGQKNSLNTSR